MSRVSVSRSSGRSVFSISGLICTVLGTVMFFSHKTFKSYLRSSWVEESTFAWYAMASLLLWWGVTHVVRPASAGSAALGLIRHRVMLPRPGMVYIVMIIVMLTGSMLGRSNMLMLVFALMAGPFVINGWVTFSMLRRIKVMRNVPSRVMAGEPATIDITLENRRFLLASWLMTVTDRIANGREELDADVLFARVPRRSSQQGSYQVRLMQRGRYFFGPLNVATRFPLGLVERSLVVPASDEILVYPRLGRLSSRWKQEHLLASELARHAPLQRGVFDDEFHAIHEFRSGDNPRAIHWRTSARQNQLMVREYHQSRDRNLLVLLDLFIPPRPQGEDEDRVELAISLAATICVEQMRTGRDSRFELGVVGAEMQRWEGRSGPAGIDSLLELLALVQPGTAPEWTRLRELASSRTSTMTEMMLITTRPLDAAEDAYRATWLGRGADGLPDVRVIEAAPKLLAEFFELN